MVKGNGKIDKIVNRLVDSLEMKGIEVSQVILYGSFASGSAKSYSDIDIAVISPSFKSKGILKRQELLGEAIFPLGEPIEALGYSPQQCKDPDPLSFLSEILSTGKIVYRRRKGKDY